MPVQRMILERCVRTCLHVCRQHTQQSQHQYLPPHQQMQLPTYLQHYRAAAMLSSNRQHLQEPLTSSCQIQPQSKLQRQLHTPRQLCTVDKSGFQTSHTTTISTYAPPLCLPIHPQNVAPPPLSAERARELIFKLKDSEREAIKEALAKYDAEMQKQGFEGTLASTQWRTRFGRLTKVPRLGEVDPTGSFCAFPDDWLKQKLVAKAKAPSSDDLRRVFFVNAVPFIAFGFLDNFVMIIAGDQIEDIFGFFMCISTMAAAGLGNTVSDIIGIGTATYVERGCDMIGLRLPDLTPIQLEMKSSRRAANWGRIVGITLGCLLGMLPLLFMEKSAPHEPTCEQVEAKHAVGSEAAKNIKPVEVKKQS